MPARNAHIDAIAEHLGRAWIPGAACRQEGTALRRHRRHALQHLTMIQPGIERRQGAAIAHAQHPLGWQANAPGANFAAPTCRLDAQGLAIDFGGSDAQLSMQHEAEVTLCRA